MTTTSAVVIEDRIRFGQCGVNRVGHRWFSQVRLSVRGIHVVERKHPQSRDGWRWDVL